jgi:hypothetical protein
MRVPVDGEFDVDVDLDTISYGVHVIPQGPR